MSLPPADPALPHLPVLLAGAATAALLEAHLPDFASGRFSLLACAPCYVRYKPGTSALVQYRLRIFDAINDAVEGTTGFFRLYSDDHGAELWAKQSLHALIRRSVKYLPDSLQDRAAYLPEMRALVQIFPVDHDLRALALVAAPRGLRRTLREVLPVEEGRPARQRAELIRYKPARKALLRAPWEGGTTGAAYVKVLSDDRGSTLKGAAEALRRDGVGTPRVLAHHRERRVIVHEAVGGAPLSALRATAGLMT